MTLRVVEGIKKAAGPDYATLYLDAFINALNAASMKYHEIHDFELLDKKKIVFYGVRAINRLSTEEQTEQSLTSKLGITEFVKVIISTMTPNEFENVFPIAKKYNGEKLGIKDYYYTKNYMKEIGSDSPIEDVNEFLWEYHNFEVSLFLINSMSAVDDMRRLDGHKSILEEIFEEKGIDTYTMFEDKNGKKYLRNNHTKEITKVKKPKPKYLYLVPNKKPAP